MAKASAIITQPDTPVKLASPSTIPSVFDLARHHRALGTEADVFDARRVKARDGSRDYSEAEACYERADNEGVAVEGLLMARPIETLADAAALALHGYYLADRGEEDHALLARAFGRLALLLIKDGSVHPDELASEHTFACIRRAIGVADQEFCA